MSYWMTNWVPDGVWVILSFDPTFDMALISLFSLNIFFVPPVDDWLIDRSIIHLFDKLKNSKIEVVDNKGRIESYRHTGRSMSHVINWSNLWLDVWKWWSMCLRDVLFDFDWCFVHYCVFGSTSNFWGYFRVILRSWFDANGWRRWCMRYVLMHGRYEWHAL